VKLTITRSSTGQVVDINTDFIVQDCNVQVSKSQYEALVAVSNNLTRMLVNWQFLPERPQEKILENQRSWWRLVEKLFWWFFKLFITQVCLLGYFRAKSETVHVVKSENSAYTLQTILGHLQAVDRQPT